MGYSKESATVGGGEAAAGPDLVAVNIRCSSGLKFSVRRALDSTVGAFKALLAQNCDVPADQQRLIYKGRILKDEQTLESYGLQADHTVHMVRGFTPATATAPGGGNGGSGLFGAGFPEFEQVQQQLTQNPSMVRDMVNTPAIQSMMNNKS